MKVKVRDGFVVNYVERVKQGDKVVEREQSYYPEDGAIDLSDKLVREHAHKLEPAGKEAADFLEKMHVPAAPAAAALDVQAIATAAALAAVQALQAQQKPAA